MSYLNAILLAEARASGRGVRLALFRHRHLADNPMAMVLWQLGAEPFTAAAVAWGTSKSGAQLVVPGEPRDRELAFRALTQVARAFNPWFERTPEPQLVVLNGGTLSLLRRLARRLAWLPTDGANAAAPELVRFGRHLRFLADYARTPGQQLVVVLTDLLRAHWVTELSDLETQHLGALDAAIEPPSRMSAHDAARRAELIGIGPVPTTEDDALEPLLSAFNERRNRKTDDGVVKTLRQPIEEHYHQLVFERGWPLLWRCVERERRLPEAAHVARRWQQDLDAHARYLAWLHETGDLRKLRQTPKQAAWTLRLWEEAQRLLVAEEIIDDPLRRLPEILANAALMGTVVGVDEQHREIATVRSVVRPLVRLQVDELSVVPDGTELYWTDAPTAQYTVVGSAKAKSGWVVTLRQDKEVQKSARPTVGSTVCFTLHNLVAAPPMQFPDSVPWTHAVSPQAIDDFTDGRGRA